MGGDLRRGVVRYAGDCSAPSSDILSEGGARAIHGPLLRNPRRSGRRSGTSLPGLRLTQEIPFTVIPANAGIQCRSVNLPGTLTSGASAILQ